jgi:HK97 family phage prohead protease
MENRKMNYRCMEIRASNPDSPEDMHIEGYAAVFNQKTLLWESDYSGYKYMEQIVPEAIDAETRMDDVVLRYNHSDGAMVLARTQNNTLTLAADMHGLKFEADIAPTTAGKDIYALIKRGDISKMSFAFKVDKESWDTDSIKKEDVRTIKHISAIVDVSPVDFPAYPGTSVSTRSNSSLIDELKAKEKELRERLVLETLL